ncbi:DUF3794 domain-containing protein [Clostridium aestuarii]|uniref:DUF3794 domain-containing protein n=1 Tax=Clostridium aestuarii TaxID=338193 RepID=A0ABT4CVY1_9CLOT|nr:DUF3794 domain-containing protein [Clostridium aestuarii]MCY6483167.1 DUF3794 domain-containing protein [Clostridium aestuarii]
MSCGCCNQANRAVDIVGLCDTDKIIFDPNVPEEYAWTEMSIPEVLRIPCQKPEIESVDRVFVRVKIISKKVIDTPDSETVENEEGTLLTGKKLIVEGILKQKIVYTALLPDQPVHSANFDIPFSAFIVLDSTAELEDEYCVETCVEDVYVKVLGKKEIFKNVTLLLRAKKLESFVCP